ncbi:predicted protein [Pyrenophora tritici-repentis Pt-1C-BFP]|uniref:Uncharacterized protein n=2 Tax=Pyrenophora tritici-repentis TaxID=45151 RepID=A0A922T2E7_9PLEO|nr:uncharacterized protein PTRG_03706 [Pyrenophora tritici-repentis Pt-1C-BFP]EDU46544.1 predicted protein [Pyrenophora tritici-repentis Pt-1C-BFP]KAI1517017.1 hypothetical protein Ptr86124_003954 [Pyrenophora tritici-repentis]KAI1682048.1 hypothetical protein KJE20_08919 [Pyrenophora tritici-repentis]
MPRCCNNPTVPVMPPSREPRRGLVRDALDYRMRHSCGPRREMYLNLSAVEPARARHG